jgi:hypothetical protein
VVTERITGFKERYGLTLMAVNRPAGPRQDDAICISVTAFINDFADGTIERPSEYPGLKGVFFDYGEPADRRQPRVSHHTTRS